MRNEKGLTLVELLAVIVILAIIAIIAVPSILQVINLSKADTHLANARNVLEVGMLAHQMGETPDGEFGGAESYSFKHLADLGYLQDTIKNTSIFSSWDVNEGEYDMGESFVLFDHWETPAVYKVNISLGNDNFIFENPLAMKEITRENLTDELKKQFRIKD